MKCVFERNIFGVSIKIFEQDGHFEFFVGGKFSASCDTIEECLEELATEIELL